MGDQQDTPQPWWRRKWIAGVLAAVVTALVGLVVGDVYPDVKEWVTGASKTPVRINAREHAHGGEFDLAAASPAGLDTKLRAAKDCNALFAAAKHAGAVAIDTSVIDLLLEGRTHRTVTITDVRARIVKREPALTGASIKCKSAAQLAAIDLVLKLDEPSPVARKNTPNGPGEPYFGQGDVVVLKREELQPVQVVALLERGAVQWKMEVDAIIDGERKTITIDNHGAPFRLTASAARYGRYFEWVWYETPQHLYVADAPKTR